MNNRIKLIACAFVSTLMIGIAAPMTAQAGTLEIYNKNCTKLVWFEQKKHVTVHVYDKTMGCTDTRVDVHVGSRKKVWLEPRGYKDPECMYRHKASGVRLEKKADVAGHRNSSVTCEKDGNGICRCTKD